MRPTQAEIGQVVVTLVERLVRSGCITVRGSRRDLDRRIANVLMENFRAEEEIERDARAMAEEIERTHGRETMGMNKQKIIALVRERLAKERGVVL